MSTLNIWDKVLWAEYNIEVTVIQVFRTAVTGVWVLDGKLCHGAILISDLSSLTD